MLLKKKVNSVAKPLTVRESKAVQYALECVDPENKRAPHYVKKQCSAWLAIVRGENPDAYVCDKTYGKICRLLKLMIHPDLQKPLYECMEPYAWLLIIAVFCTKDREGYRYYQTALLEICRKNFKTFYSGVIFIIGMLIVNGALKNAAADVGLDASNVLVFILVTLVSFNFFIELGLNIVIAPALYRSVGAIEKTVMSAKNSSEEEIEDLEDKTESEDGENEFTDNSGEDK